MRARSIALETGRVQARRDRARTGAGAVRDLRAGRAADRAAVGDRRRPTSSSSIRRSPAFENYIKGLLAETPATAINYLNAALQPAADVRSRAPGAVGRLRRAGRSRAGARGRRAGAGAIRRGRAARGFSRGLSQLHLKKYDEAFATFKALADAQPTPAVLNNLGVVQLRRGGTPQTGQPTYFFNKAAEADPDDPDYFFNLGYAYWLERDPQAAIYWLREAVRRNPADGDAHFVLGAALAPAGSAVEAARETELARRLSSTLRRSGRSGRRPRPCRRGSSASRARSSCRTRGRSSTTLATQRAARSARSWRGSISIAAGGCFSRRTIATRSSS